MDYQTSSRSHKKTSATGSNYSSRLSPVTATEPASVRYFAALANSTTPYESPYAQDRDKRPQPPAVRTSATPTATRSPREEPTYRRSSPPIGGSLSTHSSSSGGSLFTSSTSRRQQRSTTPGSMSSSKAMSSVSQFLIFVSRHTPFISLAAILQRGFFVITEDDLVLTNVTFSRFQIIRAPNALPLLASVSCCAAPDAISISFETCIIYF